MAAVEGSFSSLRQRDTCRKISSWMLSMVSLPLAWMKDRASPPSSEKIFLTVKAAETSLRWYMDLLAMKRFILGRRVMTFSSAVTMI